MNRWILALAALTLITAGACGDDGGGGGGGGGDDYCAPGGGAYFRITMSGAVDLAIDEVAGGFGCGGISAQDGSAFSSSWGGIITQIPGADFSFILDVVATEGTTGSGFEGRITATRSAADDGSVGPGIWTGSDGDCVVDLTEHTLLEASDVGGLYLVTGSGSCTQLAVDDLTIESFEFSGVTVWF